MSQIEQSEEGTEETVTATTEPAVNDTTPPENGESAATITEEDDFDKDRALSTIRNQRRETKELAKENKELRRRAARLDEIEAETLSETEKAQKRADELEAKLQSQRDKVREAQLLTAISDIGGVVSVKDAAILLKGEGIEFDDDDKPVDIAEKVGALLEEKPFLRAQSAPATPAVSINGGSGHQTERAPQLTASEVEAAKKAGKTPHEWAALKNVTTLDDYEAYAEKVSSGGLKT